MASQSLLIWVYGRVQGVGFRYSTQRQAKALGVYGYARNCADGSVEVLASGDSEKVAQLLSWLRAGGPRTARVDKVVEEPHASGEAWHSFEIRN